MSDPPIAGTVARGWEPVRDVFIDNFGPSDRDPGDLGAGLCVIASGKTVVDLWGGWRDRNRRRPFEADSLVNSYSIGKGVSAAVALVAISRGVLDLDTPARTCWTELGLETTLRHHLTHQAGLPALRDEVDDDIPMDWHRMCAALATTEPWWEPGTAHGYHTNTAGFLVGEPIRRAAGAARFGDLLRDWFARPLGGGGRTPTAPDASDLRDPHRRLLHHAYFNPATLSGMGVVETRRWRQAEVPSTNLHATAKGVARVYASLLDLHGPVDPAVLVEATSTQVDGPDIILERRSRFGLGFQLHQDDRAIGVSETSFGHFGFGGSIGFADREAGIAVGYVINRPGDRWQMPRTRRLLAVLREVTGRSS